MFYHTRFISVLIYVTLKVFEAYFASIGFNFNKYFNLINFSLPGNYFTSVFISPFCIIYFHIIMEIIYSFDPATSKGVELSYNLGYLIKAELLCTVRPFHPVCLDWKGLSVTISKFYMHRPHYKLHSF